MISLFLNGDLPAFLTYLILGRDTLLMAAGFVLRYKSLEPPVRAFALSEFDLLFFLLSDCFYFH